MKLLRMSGILIMLPYLLGFSPNDTSFTTIEFLAGQGSYAEVTRDCSGRVLSVEDVPYTEAGIAVRRVTQPFTFGVAGGVTTGTSATEAFGWSTPAERRTSIPYVRPFAGLHFTHFGLEGGVNVPLRKPGGQTDDYGDGYAVPPPEAHLIPCGFLRIGRYDKVHFSMSFAYNTPLQTGGSIFDMGFGVTPSFWIGIGGFPSEGLVVISRGNLRLNEHLSLVGRIHFGGANAWQYGVAGGVLFAL